MKQLLASASVVGAWLSLAPAALAASYSTLTPCGENAAFQARAQAATELSDIKRFENYAQLLCGDDGLPHLIVDGNLAHAAEFLIPGVMFLYVAGWIGWVGRKYLQAIKAEGNPEEKEIVIDVPLALKCSLSGFAWPLEAFKQITTGEMFASEAEIPVSPR